MSTNGRVSKSWSQPWTHLRVDRCSPSSCRVTFDHAPINAITATTVEELSELVELIDQDHDLNVVVFDSANPDFYLTGSTRIDAWLELLDRLSRAPVVSIASIRGRARGAGSEFVLARTESCVDQLTSTELMPRPAGTRGLAMPLPAPGAS